MAFTDEEIKEFKTEAEELLDSAEKSLLALDKGASFESHYDSIFRTFHSLKGAAGMMEITDLQAHMHQLENIFTQRKGQKNLEKQFIDFFLRGADAARTILKGDQVQFDYNIEKQIEQPQDSLSSSKPKPANPEARNAQLTAPLARILIVDDEPELLDILSETLKGANAEVSSTNLPEKALDLIKAFQPDVLLSDINMPKMTGMELLAAVQKLYPDLPVVFLSGYLSKEALMEAIQLGIYGVLEKPFNHNQVIETCLNAARKFQLTKLLNSSINLMMFQFSDLDEFLRAQGKDDVRASIKKEITAILEQRRSIRSLKKFPSAP